MDIEPIKKEMKKTCREYRKSCVLGKRMQLTTLRIIWYAAFLSGAKFQAEQTIAELRKGKT